MRLILICLTILPVLAACAAPDGSYGNTRRGAYVGGAVGGGFGP